MYAWRDIATVPAAPGVYAWYYTPEITAYDMRSVVEATERLKAAGDRQGAEASVRDFLHKAIFRHFQQQPYTATLKAPLMPRYEGRVDHQPRLSDGLVQRLVDDLDRLGTLKEVLATSVPDFASPIYIGMSKRLRDRLARHKALIERDTRLPSELADDDGEDEDHSFASEVLSRGIPPTQLSVAVRVVGGAEGSYVDLENVLNRIHRPLMGRN